MILKRFFDVIFAVLAVLIFGIVIIICILLATLDTQSFGLFVQTRIGQFGKPFKIFKIKTLHDKSKTSSRLGSFLRKSKIDELPQLFNILNGTMSFVGPRPDIPGYADVLKGEDRLVLKVRPGVTGLASLKYRNEEQLLSQQPNPLHYNDAIIWPDKVNITKWYVQNHSFKLDIKILIYTFLPISFSLKKFIK